MAANTLAGFAGSVEILLVARILAGVGAAMIMPVTLSVITSSFPAEQRARAVGIWSGFAGAGGILGLFVSSFLIDQFTWPWLFAMPVVFAAVSLVMSLSAVGNSREHHEGRFDTVGSILSALAIGGLVLGIHEGPEKGWFDLLTMVGLIVGVVSLVGFIVWELRQTKPLLEIRLFANRGLAAGSLTLLIVFAVMFGIFLVLTQFMQAVLGYSALAAAGSLLPMMLVMMPLSAVAPTIANRIGTRNVLLTGVGLFGLGLALLASMVSAEGGYWSVLPGLIVVSFGIGLCMSPSTMTITESLPHDKQGVASALNDTVRELGGAVGIALLGSLVSAGYRTSVSVATTDLSPELAHRVEEGIGSAFGAAGDLGGVGPVGAGRGPRRPRRRVAPVDVVRRGPRRRGVRVPPRARPPARRRGRRGRPRQRAARARAGRRRLRRDRCAPGGCETRPMADVDELSRRATTLVTALARKGMSLATGVAVIVLIIGGLSYLTGLAGLTGSARALWTVLGLGMLVVAVGAPLLARWRLSSVIRRGTRSSATSAR